jgi:hypothetical protein
VDDSVRRLYRLSIWNIVPGPVTISPVHTSSRVTSSCAFTISVERRRNASDSRFRTRRWGVHDTVHPNRRKTCMVTMSKVGASIIGARLHSASQSSTALLLTCCSQQHVCISPNCQHITYMNDSDPGLMGSRYPLRDFCHGAPGCVYFMHVFSCTVILYIRLLVKRGLSLVWCLERQPWLYHEAGVKV